MTEPTEKNLLLAHDVLGDRMLYADKVLGRLARYLDERDADGARREAHWQLQIDSLKYELKVTHEQHEAFRDEVERVVDMALTLLTALDYGDSSLTVIGLRRLKRAKPEPSPWEQHLRDEYPEFSDEEIWQAAAWQEKRAAKLGLELVRKGEVA